MKFKTVEQVVNEFKRRSMGEDILEGHENVRLHDIEKHKDPIQELLNTDYNNIRGWNFEEILDATSHFNSHTFSKYRNSGDINESFLGTTQGQAPYPILNQGLTLFQYDGSVLPYLAHIFDLKGNRGYAYYMELVATKAIGGVSVDNVVASPKQLSTQTSAFVGTRVASEESATTVAGTTSYSFTLAYAPVMPQTLVITIDGITGSLQEKEGPISNTSDIAYLIPIAGNPGTANINLTSGLVTLELASSPAQTGLGIRCSYSRDVETSTGGTNNQAKVAPKLASVSLKASDYQVALDTTIHQERLSQVIFGLDWDAEMDSLLESLYNREVANSIIDDINSAVPSTTPDSVFTHDIDPGASTGNNPLFSTAFMGVVIGKLGQLIASASGISAAFGGATSLVIAADFVPIIKALPKFKSSVVSEAFMSGVSLIGTYDGVPVLASFKVTTGTVLGLYRSRDKAFLTPAVFGTFILPILRNVIDKDNLAINKKALISSAAQQVVVPNLAAKMTVTGISTIL